MLLRRPYLDPTPGIGGFSGGQTESAEQRSARIKEEKETLGQKVDHLLDSYDVKSSGVVKKDYFILGSGEPPENYSGLIIFKNLSGDVEIASDWSITSIELREGQKAAMIKEAHPGSVVFSFEGDDYVLIFNAGGILWQATADYQGQFLLQHRELKSGQQAPLLKSASPSEVEMIIGGCLFELNFSRQPSFRKYLD